MPEEEGPEEIDKVEVVTPAPETPPEHADLIIVEEAVANFRGRGLPRHMRKIQKYCARKNDRALACHHVPTENGIRYMNERSSITRFIGDAAQQASTGKLTDENNKDLTVVQRTPSAPSDDGIFEHSFVKRLEEQVERLERRNQKFQADIQSVLIRSLLRCKRPMRWRNQRPLAPPCLTLSVSDVSRVILPSLHLSTGKGVASSDMHTK